MRSKGIARVSTAGAKRVGAKRKGAKRKAVARSLADDPVKACAAALRARRRALGLTQSQLADLAGVGLAFLYELELGKPTVRLDKLLDVARTLGLELRLIEGKLGLSVDPALRATSEP
jgi:HTH-type transcriptional regulator/antitoxin HipB